MKTVDTAVLWSFCKNGVETRGSYNDNMTEKTMLLYRLMVNI